MKDLKDMSLEELWQLFPIILREHNTFYSTWYEEEKVALLQILQDYNVSRINHIGSTSVSGLIAKPIVDILLELPKNYDMTGTIYLLQQNGWILMQRNEDQKILDFNKGYTPTGFAEKVFHLHIKPFGNWGELYFRDYLRENTAIAKQYETLKRCLMKQFKHNRDAYTDAKSTFIVENTIKAKEKYNGRYEP